MSYIQFESAREKEKARQELRDARAEMLQQAKDRAELRSQRERQKELRGEGATWMLPAVAQKLEKASSVSSSKKAKKKKKAEHKSKSKGKKSSKKKKKKHHSSSSSESSSDSESSSSSSSSEDEKERRRRKKKSKKKRQESQSEDEWVERTPATEVPLQRDNWMTNEALLLKTFSREQKQPTKPNEKLQQIDAYDPAKSGRELNPYWKSNGTGLPGFQKPQDDDDSEERGAKQQSLSGQSSSSRGWRKPSAKPPSPRRSKSVSESESSGEEPEPEEAPALPCLTDEQINELAGRAIKAELKGKKELAADLNQQLENARKARAEFLASGKSVPKSSAKEPKKKSASEHVLLTKTDQSGNVRPLVHAGAQSNPNDLYGGSKGRNRSNKKVETHVDGQRVRYFADDDRFDIKQMVRLGVNIPIVVETLHLIFSPNSSSGRSMPLPLSPTCSTPTFCPSTRIPMMIWKTCLPTKCASKSHLATPRRGNSRVPSRSTRSWPPVWRTVSAASTPLSWTSSCWFPWVTRSTLAYRGTLACRMATAS